MIADISMTVLFFAALYYSLAFICLFGFRLLSAHLWYSMAESQRSQLVNNPEKRKIFWHDMFLPCLFWAMFYYFSR